MASTEDSLKHSTSDTVKQILTAACEEQKAELLRLQGLQVEGRTVGENLRITEANILRREKALGKIKEEGLSLQDRITELHAKMAALQSDFITKSGELARDKEDKARLLARQASEAAAGLPAAAPQPAVAAAVPPTAEALFATFASLPNFGEVQRQALLGIFESLQVRVQPVPAEAVRVPGSPLLEPAAAPVVEVELPATEGVAPTIAPTVGDGTAEAPPAATAPAATQPEPTPPAGQPTPQGPEPRRVGEGEAEGIPDTQIATAAKAACAAGAWMAALDEERAAKKGRKTL